LNQYCALAPDLQYCPLDRSRLFLQYYRRMSGRSADVTLRPIMTDTVEKVRTSNERETIESAYTVS
jgi:hypothetical protein